MGILLQGSRSAFSSLMRLMILGLANPFELDDRRYDGVRCLTISSLAVFERFMRVTVSPEWVS